MGPMIDFSVGRTKLASEDLYKSAMAKPKELKVIGFLFIHFTSTNPSTHVKVKPRNKNVSHDVFGSKVAQIHVGRQKANTIPTRKVRALKRGQDGRLKGGHQ